MRCLTFFTRRSSSWERASLTVIAISDDTECETVRARVVGMYGGITKTIE